MGSLSQQGVYSQDYSNMMLCVVKSIECVLGQMSFTLAFIMILKEPCGSYTYRFFVGEIHEYKIFKFYLVIV